LGLVLGIWSALKEIRALLIKGKKWLDIKKIKAEYKNTLKMVFETPLPLDEDLNITLKDVYTDSKGVYDVLSQETLENKEVSNLIWDCWEENKNNFLFLLGLPGSGKSSLIKKLSYDWAEDNKEPFPRKISERDLYTVQLRHLPKEFKDEPIEVLIKYLRGEYNPPYDPFLWNKEVIYLFKGFQKSILLLDGLDEFAMNYQLTEEDTLELLEKLVEGLKKYDCKVLITSRPNYLSLNSLDNLNKRLNYTVWELKPFSYGETVEFLKKYKNSLQKEYEYKKRTHPQNTQKIYFDNFNLLKARLENNLNKKNTAVNLPLVLYMLAHLYLRKNETPEIENNIELYEKVVNAVIKRIWENNNHLKKVISSADWFKLYRSFLEELAFLIEFSNKEFATLEEIEKLNSFTILKEETKLQEKELLGKLLTFFYIHRGKNKKTQTVEFIHKTFQEYLAACNIYNQLLENLELETNRYENIIWNLFSKNKIPLKVREFLEQIIEKRREEDREKQNQFLEKMKEIFPSLLEKDFIVKPCELGKEKPLNKPLWCFGNLWIFASKVSEVYLEELKDIPDNEKWKYHFLKKYKNKLTCLIKRTQVQEETMLNTFPLTYSNLMEGDLCKANLITAKLAKANLSKAFLWGVNLGFADLSYANLSYAYLIDAFLRDAILENANLEGADLRGAIFDPEEIKKAKNWDKAIYDEDMKKKLGLK